MYASRMISFVGRFNPTVHVEKGHSINVSELYLLNSCIQLYTFIQMDKGHSVNVSELILVYTIIHSYTDKGHSVNV